MSRYRCLEPAGRMLAITVQLDGIALLLADLAAILAVLAALLNHAFAGRMRALFRVSHRNLP